MDVKEWLRAAVIGVAVGGLATAGLGFSYGGWVTTAKALEQAAAQGELDVGMALVPYCVQAAHADPEFPAALVRLKAGTSYDREAIVSKAGWATPLGSTEPLEALAFACQEKLAEDFS